MRINSLILSVILIAAFIFVPGCGPQRNAEDLKKALLEFDPPFKDILVKKAALDSQIETLKGDFRNKQAEINNKIMELEEELKGVRRQNYAQIKELTAKLDPERLKINAKLIELSMMLKSKEGLYNTLKNQFKETKKLLEDKKLGLSQADEAKWQSNLDDLNRQIPVLEAEIAALKRQIDFYRQELNLLKY